MKQVFLFVACFFLCFSLNAQPVKIMLVTGGHAYDTTAFFQMFDALEGIEYEHFAQPVANKSIVNGRAKDFDVLVFYDMWKNISEKEKKAYMNLTRKGKPFLFLHHSLASYQNWENFEHLLGGKYVEKSSGVSQKEESTFKHDVWVDIEIIDSQHPVTRGFQDFRLFDEVYGNFRVSSGVKPLLKTNHPESSPVIGWENKYNASTIVYLQPGHDSHAFKSEHFRNLLSNSINYLSNSK
jgi:uncharacterized protein